MAEWRGPWKCEASGTIVDQLEKDNKGPYHSLYPYGDRCRGPFTPHDRRAPDALLEEAERLRAEVQRLQEEIKLLIAPQPLREKALRSERDVLEKALRDIEQWTQIAFYPGPNENPHFQAGFQEAVGVAAGIVARLLSALATILPEPEERRAGGEEEKR